MPPLRTSSPLSRNTINQRASRARRKEFIESLIQKLREYETEGVQATTHVQLAARRVAEENRTLREEIRILTERQVALEARLLQERNEVHRDTGIVAAGTSQISDWKPQHEQWETPLLTFDSQDPTLDPNQAQELYVQKAADISALALPTLDLQSESQMKANNYCPIFEDQSTELKIFSQCPPRSSAGGDRAEFAQINPISCAQAAVLIAVMRGVSITDESTLLEILSEIGCNLPLGDTGSLSREGNPHGQSCARVGPVESVSGPYLQAAQHCVPDMNKLRTILKTFRGKQSLTSRSSTAEEACGYEK